MIVGSVNGARWWFAINKNCLNIPYINKNYSVSFTHKPDQIIIISEYGDKLSWEQQVLLTLQKDKLFTRCQPKLSTKKKLSAITLTKLSHWSGTRSEKTSAYTSGTFWTQSADSVAPQQKRQLMCFFVFYASQLSIVCTVYFSSWHAIK